ncbi:MAG TPA: energy transducer TonB [Candidatus Goldiibacteriota bacterium]|nr:energy transducer TonB [Candidatus Goldiibacteriota bacterium]
MKLKTENLKLKAKTGNTALTAALLTVMLHAAAFSVPAAVAFVKSRPGSPAETAKKTAEDEKIFVDVSVLPAVRKMGQEDVIRKQEGEKSGLAEEDAGTAAKAEKSAAGAEQEEVLTYRNLIKQRIQRARRYPQEARRAGMEGSVEMEFTVSRAGELLRSNIISGSGSGLLDEEAVATLKRAAPFPEMQGKEPEITMKIRLVYKLD